jgi:hypothetical protein
LLLPVRILSLRSIFALFKESILDVSYSNLFEIIRIKIRLFKNIAGFEHSGVIFFVFDPNDFTIELSILLNLLVNEPMTIFDNIANHYIYL